MARVLAISSQVARGHIGLSAVVPALQRLGHEVWPLPTILLSNHPGHPHAAGMRIDPAVLEEMVDALERNGWLGEVDAVITGYLPSPEHVQFSASVIRRLRGTKDVFYLCDPVLGDEPEGVYIDPHAAGAILEELVPCADVLTPNRFELQWLAEKQAETPDDLVGLAATLKVPRVVVTSAFRHDGLISTLLIGADGRYSCSAPYREPVPHGTGDFFAGLMLGHQLNDRSAVEAMALAAAGLDHALSFSESRDELQLVASQAAWAAPDPLPVRPWEGE
ncbi:MAG: pyridoxal kinase [Proteobacteria bacterium]|jgi:pyridoxal kinase|nr:MAG: pyridoxal kinase [Pseudomonadota bacterium]